MVFETLLGSSWADLGLILERLRPQNRAVAAVALEFSKNHFLAKVVSQELCCTQLEPFWDRKGNPKGTPNRAKNDHKMTPKITSIWNGSTGAHATLWV